MTVYISLLRGINVNGQRQIKMQQLKTLYETLGFSNVSTYIQSGNVVFCATRRDSGSMEAQIEDAIANEFGFEVPVIVRSLPQMESVIHQVPIKNLDEPKHVHVTFLEHAPKRKLDISAYLSPSEECHFCGSEIYLYCPLGYGKTKLSNRFFEKQLQQKATTRNWKTVLTLHGMAEL